MRIECVELVKMAVRTPECMVDLLKIKLKFISRSGYNHTRFPVIHRVDNVGIFALLIFENK